MERIYEVFIERPGGYWSGEPESLGFFNEEETPKLEEEYDGEGRLFFEEVE